MWGTWTYKKEAKSTDYAYSTFLMLHGSSILSPFFKVVFHMLTCQIRLVNNPWTRLMVHAHVFFNFKQSSPISVG